MIRRNKELINLANLANVLRGLVMDMTGKEHGVNSGHPGVGLGTAEMVAVLFMKHLNIHRGFTGWHNRDRFVMSGGHNSAILYSILSLLGFIPFDELKKFRQLGSMTPGHPEYDLDLGIETTTGPLGQGFANAVGMAIAQKMLQARLENKEMLDHHVYVMCGDGDLMEGVSYESASLAGHLGLDNLIVLYDSNCITIEGGTDITFSENIQARFESQGWEVDKISGHDIVAIDEAIEDAKKCFGKPHLIICNTCIGKGCSKEGTCQIHGEPLSVDETRVAKMNLGLPPDESYYIPDDLKQMCRQRRAKVKEIIDEWFGKCEKLDQNDQVILVPKNIDSIPSELQTYLHGFKSDKAKATREYSGTIMQVIAGYVQFFFGGSADLAPSNKTGLCNFQFITPCIFNGRNIHFGVREFAMGAITNGMALYFPSIRPFCATFLVFADYMKPAIRMAALMKLPVIYVLTHDSFAVGEDGSTHQPIEHLAMLRSIPNLTVIRPCDGPETAEAWLSALQNQEGPTALILSRQTLSVLERNERWKNSARGEVCCSEASNLHRGAYVLTRFHKPPSSSRKKHVIVASGSEVGLAIEVAKILDEKHGIYIEIVSMPSWELFRQQPREYQEEILPRDTFGYKIIVIEAGSSQGWHEFAGREGLIISIDHFGASAPHKDLQVEFGFTPEAIAERFFDI
jgi:transketolase